MRKVDPGTHSGGFSLIELLVTIAILTILVGVAAPTFTEFTANHRLRTASFDLMSDLALARSEALKRGANVVITPAEGGWENGWTVTTAGAAQPLSEHGALESVEVSGGPANITFNRNGRIAGGGGIVRIELGSTRSDDIEPRCLSIDPSGRPRSVKQACPS